MNSNHREYVIDVKNLTKSFGDVVAVDGISLQVKRGDIYGFLGPNGSGKTSTIRMLCGLLTPDRAEGTCLQYDILTQSDEIKKNVGYMTQRFSLYQDLSVFENLYFTARVYSMKNKKEATERCLERFGFGDRRNQLAGTLSGGWKQRLALAAALLHEPQLLLLDEPTAGVDPKARRDFWSEVYRLSREGITTLVSTHYMDEAERCSQLTYISKGHILITGTPEEIIQNSKLSTWVVTGPDLIELEGALTDVPGIDYIIPFGRILHVSGENEEKLNAAVAAARLPEHHWSKITPTLEDIFIELISKRNSL